MLMAALSNPVVSTYFVVVVLLSAESRMPFYLVMAECIYVRPNWAGFDIIEGSFLSR